VRVYVGFTLITENQVYASWSVKYTFELGGNGVTADYALTAVPRMISVINQCKPPFLLSAFKRVEGVAMQSPTHPGAFSVSFNKRDTASLRFNPPGNYWIIKLGPIIDGVCLSIVPYLASLHDRFSPRRQL